MQYLKYVRRSVCVLSLCASMEIETSNNILHSPLGRAGTNLCTSVSLMITYLIGNTKMKLILLLHGRLGLDE